MQRTDIRKSSDETTNGILFEGATMAQLAVLFKIDGQTLKRRMHGIMPTGRRYNTVIYDVAEVAARMGKLTEDQVDAAMRRLNHADLPKMLTKEYWNGLRARQAFELADGNLWETQKVVSEVGEMVKSLKMELDLLIDGVERATELSEKQREAMVKLIDGAKINMVKRLAQKFKVPEKRTVVAVTSPWEDDDEL